MDKRWINIGTTAVCTLAAVMLVICTGMAAPFGFVLGLLASVFVGYLSVGCGLICGVICAAIVGITSFVLGGNDFLLISALGIIPGIVTGIMHKKDFDYYTSLIWVSLSFGVVTGLLLYVFAAGFEDGINGFFRQAAELIKTSMSQLVMTAGVKDLELSDINALAEESIALIKRTIPSVIIIFSAIFGYIHIALVKFFTKKVFDADLNYVELSSHKAPRHISYMYFIAMLLLIFGIGKGTFGIVLDNLTSVLDFILAFCGLSLIENKFRKKLKYGFLRALIYIIALAVFSGIGMQLLSVIGMADSFLNFRKIKRIGE